MLQCSANGDRPPAGMGAGASPWLSRPFLRAQDRQHDVVSLPVFSPWSLPYITRARCGVDFLSLFCRRRRLAPPLAAAAVEPPPATQTTPPHSPHSRASHGPSELAFFHPNRPHHRFLSQLRRLSATEAPHVASPLHRLPVPPSCFTTLTMSSCCLSCIQFNRYQLFSPGHRSPRPPCRHGRQEGFLGV
jgi:hypothetical protein